MSVVFENLVVEAVFAQIEIEDLMTEAVFLGRFESGTPEWHDLRSRGIGGSEVGTILGLNRWESPFTLWCKRTGRIDSQIPQSEAMEWGSRLEPVILEKFQENHPELKVDGQPGTYCHPVRDWQIANPDAVFETDGPDGKVYGLVEVKTAQFEDDWSDGVPRHYEAQVQWYLNVFGYSYAYVVALFHGNRYREYLVEANRMWQESAIEAATLFWNQVGTDTAPELDGSLSTYQTVRETHPEITDDEVELGFLGEQYFKAKADVAEAEKELNLLKSHILEAMGTAKRGLVDDVWVFTRQSRSGGTPFLVEKRG
jgi:putative phage-type endonuclease